MEGNWIVTKVEGKDETDQASGVKLFFEEEQRMLFNSIAGVQHREQHGKLKLMQGTKEVFKGEGMLKRTDKHPKARDKTGLSKFWFKPTTRLDVKEFGRFFGMIGTTVEASWTGKFEGQDDAGDDRPHADDPDEDFDDNVVPGSNADHMKRNARKPHLQKV